MCTVPLSYRFLRTPSIYLFVVPKVSDPPVRRVHQDDQSGGIQNEGLEHILQPNRVLPPSSQPVGRRARGRLQKLHQTNTRSSEPDDPEAREGGQDRHQEEEGRGAHLS